ncbi:MAG: hypothetical protein H6686_01450 [Fibrobacteria bacterium]|nr:hypothetical protein [Fibrobacteria bacterium]
MRTFLVLIVALASVSSAAYKLTAAVAPAVVHGDVDPTLAPWTGRAVAEMLSWEISMVQTIRVVDPATLEKHLAGWEFRNELTEDALDLARTAGRQIDVEAVLVPELERRGGLVSLRLVAVVHRNLEDRRIQLAVEGGADEVLGKMRGQVVNALDSLEFPVPASLRQLASNRFQTKWEALLEYGRALQSLAVGDKEAGLTHLRQTLSIEPTLAAAQVRTRTLEKELGR